MAGPKKFPDELVQRGVRLALESGRRIAEERRFLTRQEFARLLDEARPKWRPLFDLLASRGLRISDAFALRWSDLHLDAPAPRLQGRPRGR
jgi:integrase